MRGGGSGGGGRGGCERRGEQGGERERERESESERDGREGWDDDVEKRVLEDKAGVLEDGEYIEDLLR